MEYLQGIDSEVVRLPRFPGLQQLTREHFLTTDSCM